MDKKVNIKDLLTAIKTGNMAYITVTSLDSNFELTIEDIQSNDIDYVASKGWIALNNVSCLIPVSKDITLTVIKDFDDADLSVYIIRDGSIKVAFAVR